MNKNELVTVINVKDGRKKHLIAALAYNDAYLERHGFKRVEAPVSVAQVAVATAPQPAKAAKVKPTDTEKPKTEAVDPFDI